MTPEAHSDLSAHTTPSVEVPETTDPSAPPLAARAKHKSKDRDGGASSKRRCVSTACVACRKRKSKCDGQLPKCAACASVYLTECEYAPHTDHRRKGVYKKEVDAAKTKNTTLQVLIQAILTADDDDVMDLVGQIRTCDSLEELAASIEAQERGVVDAAANFLDEAEDPTVPMFEAELSGKMGDLMLDGSVKFIGGTSNLIWLPEHYDHQGSHGSPAHQQVVVRPREEAILSWTTVTQDKDLILHFMNMYFCWHYAFFTTLSKELFYRDFLTGTTSQYCSPLLVNVMLALGCHFSSRPTARADPEDSGTTGDHFFAEAKRLLYQNDEFANARLSTVQALALMSVREAGCGHESKGWVYSGMSFRMACDLGLNVDAQPMSVSSRLADEDIDARRITFWGCFLFDKCWSNYLGRQPQLQMPGITVKKPEVFASEDSEMWSPYTDSGIIQAHMQPARTRAVALQLSKLAEISSDLLTSFYNPQQLEKPLSKQAERKRLSDVHTSLEAWKQSLPSEMEPHEGQLPQVLLMHMLFQLLYIHLYRPFLKYNKATSPLPVHVSPRKYCTQGAAAISKLFRLYKRTHGLRQICNIAIYIVHSACTIHLLNLPDKNARRDIIHGIRHLEEMGDCWTAARRTLRVLHVCAERWRIELPMEAEMIYTRIRTKWGPGEGPTSPVSPQSLANMTQQMTSAPLPDVMAQNVQLQQQQQQEQQQKPPPPSTTTAALRHPAIDQTQEGLSFPMAPSLSETNAMGVPSGEFSLNPQSTADFNQDIHHVRPSTTIPQAPQTDWHAHQSPMVASGSQGAERSTSQMFGSVDNLLEETQDWFLKDQSQLAMGFENWGGPEPQDWGSLDLTFFDTPPAEGDPGWSAGGNTHGDDRSSPYAISNPGGSGSGAGDIQYLYHPSLDGGMGNGADGVGMDGYAALNGTKGDNMLYMGPGTGGFMGSMTMGNSMREPGGGGGTVKGSGQMKRSSQSMEFEGDGLYY